MLLLKSKKVDFDLLRIIPKLSSNSKKGDNGKFAIIGGSFEYTGAPYYVGISSLRGGADLSHIFCTYDAGIPIKSYSPELIVHPLLPESSSDAKIKENNMKMIKKWINTMHGYAIGPGLGRNEFLGDYIREILTDTDDNKQITIIDADGLWHVMNNESLYKFIVTRKNVILTPNIGEFDRLWEKFMSGKDRLKINEEKDIRKSELIKDGYSVFELELDDPLAIEAVELSKKLNNINLLAKGDVDILTNGKLAYGVIEEGSLKRCGGQGDILVGLLMVYSYWAKEKGFDKEGNLLLGGLLACLTVRKASKKAFGKKFIGLTAPDVIDHIIEAFLEIYNIKK